MGQAISGPLDARGAADSLFPNIDVSAAKINHGASLASFTLTNAINGVFAGQGVMLSSTDASLFQKRDLNEADQFLQTRGIKNLTFDIGPSSHRQEIVLDLQVCTSERVYDANQHGQMVFYHVGDGLERSHGLSPQQMQGKFNRRMDDQGLFCSEGQKIVVTVDDAPKKVTFALADNKGSRSYCFVRHVGRNSLSNPDRNAAWRKRSLHEGAADEEQDGDIRKRSPQASTTRAISTTPAAPSTTTRAISTTPSTTPSTTRSMTTSTAPSTTLSLSTTRAISTTPAAPSTTPLITTPALTTPMIITTPSTTPWTTPSTTPSTTPKWTTTSTTWGTTTKSTTWSTTPTTTWGTTTKSTTWGTTPSTTWGTTKSTTWGTTTWGHTTWTTTKKWQETSKPKKHHKYGEWCYSSRDCYKGSCYQGQCVPLYNQGHKGDYCNNDNQCDCSKFYCSRLYNQCEYKKPLGSWCPRDSVCYSGKCDGHQCVPQYGQGHEGDFCNEDGQCSSYYCDKHEYKCGKKYHSSWHWGKI